MLGEQKVRPSVFLAVAAHDKLEAKLREIKAGMEEEGIPWRLTEQETGDAARLAHEAAFASPLGVGVGVSGEGLCIHYRKLALEEPLFIHPGTGDPSVWRLFGYNAARLVKGIPFKEKAEEVGVPADEAEVVAEEDLTSLVAEIVRRMLQETAGAPGGLRGHGR
nr:glycerol dehydratase reactivase beta/small subunit family protein [uncultured Anaeromusa sp.]